MASDSSQVHLGIAPAGETAAAAAVAAQLPRNASMSRFKVDVVPHEHDESDYPEEQAAAASLNGDVICFNPSVPAFDAASPRYIDSTGISPLSNRPLDNMSPRAPSPLPPVAVVQPRTVQFTVASDGGNSSTFEGDSGRRMSSAYQKSFRNVETLERLPDASNYRNIMSLTHAISSRPTLAELHEEKLVDGDVEEQKISQFIAPVEPKPSGGVKFGWIKGVLVRCVLNIIGVMLYLRLSWVAGQAGVGLGSVIVLLSTAVSVLTAISLCAICTNGEVRGGGAYFMISRSLGPEFGGSIGLIFALANAVAVAMYAVGFAETVRDLMLAHGAMIVDGQLNDIRIIASSATVLMLVITQVGMEWEAKTQLGLLAVLMVSIVAYVVGTFIPPSDALRAKGVTGYSASTFTENFYPDFRGEYNFMSVFAIFFPAVTGILAGANISGDLADPQKAIPKGTLWAVLLTSVLYFAFIWTTGATVLRDASGDLMEYFNGTFTECRVNATCRYGLLWDYNVLQITSVWGPLVLAGIFAATLSSALASLVSAPKIFQAVCKDELFPYTKALGKGFGKSDEPRFLYFVAFAIAIGMICVGDLNAIAPYISNFFLAAYGLINFAVFAAGLSSSPGFRPAFKYYNMWLSLGGAALCVAVMFIISWQTALITYAFIAALYMFIRHRNPEVNWGSSSQAQTYKNALHSVLKLQNTEEHVKNYRPQVLCLTGNPTARPSLVDFAANLTCDRSLLICGHVIVDTGAHFPPSLYRLRSQVELWLKERHVKAFYSPVVETSLRQGVVRLLQLSGMGKLRPNVIMMGFKANWQQCQLSEINEYFQIIHDAFDANVGISILRVPTGLDYSELLRTHKLALVNTMANLLPAADESSTNLKQQADETNCLLSPSKAVTSVPMSYFYQKNSNTNVASNNDKDMRYSPVNTPPEEEPCARKAPLFDGSPVVSRRNSPVTHEVSDLLLERNNSLSVDVTHLNPEQKAILESVDRFQHRIKKAQIDVWWLFDDGGLTVLLPHLLSLDKSYLEGAKLRVFTIARSRNQLEAEQRRMAALLSKFRIEYSDVFVIPDITKRPREESRKEFEDLIQRWRVGDDEDDYEVGLLTDAELLSLKDKTNRQIRTRELLKQHSQSATLIVVTLPIPRKGGSSSSLYMAWLETLTRDLPPILLVRGNQQSVLTFYS